MTDLHTVELAEQGPASYRAEIRGITRGLWTGAYDYDQAFELMMFNIRAGLTNAWHNGMREVGLQPTDMTAEERTQLERVIFDEFTHVDGFLTAIEQGSKANGGKLRPLMARADLWINRYKDVQNQAKQAAQNDPKLKWVVDPAKESCTDCLALNDKVKRASVWKRYGYRPQMPDLECGGWACGCILQPTNEPLSKGPLPKLVGA